MRKTTGTAMKVLCLERNLACSPSAGSNSAPAAAAAIILRLAGRIQNQTLAVITVPNIAPTWIKAARPLRTCIRPQEIAAVITSENVANAHADLLRYDRTARRS